MPHKCPLRTQGIRCEEPISLDDLRFLNGRIQAEFKIQLNGIVDRKKKRND
jgi:hypothetical protein